MLTPFALVRLFFSSWGAAKSEMAESEVGGLAPVNFVTAMKMRMQPVAITTKAHWVAQEIIKESVHTGFDNLEALQQSGLLGTRYRHWGNGHRYILVDFMWDSEVDEWKVVYEREALNADRSFIRSFKNAFEDVKEGVPRFMQVD